MKKRTLLIIGIALSVLIVFTSCEDSLSGTLGNFMNPFNKKNVYVDSGLIKVSTEKVTAVVSSVSESTSTEKVTVTPEGSADESGNVTITLGASASDSGVISSVNTIVQKATKAESVTDLELKTTQELADIISTNGILSAQDTDTSSSISAAIAEIYVSPELTSALKAELSATSENTASSDAAKGTLALIASALSMVDEETLNDLGTENASLITTAKDTLVEYATSETNLTEGQILEVQILTNCVSYATDSICEIIDQITSSDVSSSTELDISGIVNAVDQLTTLMNISDILGDSSILGISGIISNIQL